MLKRPSTANPANRDDHDDDPRHDDGQQQWSPRALAWAMASAKIAGATLSWLAANSRVSTGPITLAKSPVARSWASRRRWRARLVGVNRFSIRPVTMMSMASPPNVAG